MQFLNVNTICENYNKTTYFTTCHLDCKWTPFLFNIIYIFTKLQQVYIEFI
jgi:hypothetical protein